MIAFPAQLELRLRIRSWDPSQPDVVEHQLLAPGQLLDSRQDLLIERHLTGPAGQGTWLVRLALQRPDPACYGRLDIDLPDQCRLSQPAEQPLIALTGNLSLTLQQGEARQTSVELVLGHCRWSAGHYLMMPAGAYQGNRFRSIYMKYPPMLQPEMGIGPDMEPIISDVPRLAIEPGFSCLELTSSDLATPLFAWHDPADRQPGAAPNGQVTQPVSAFFMTGQGNDLGQFGMTVTESEDRSAVEMAISSPAMRRQYHYTIASCREPSRDRPADLRQGQSLAIPFQLHVFPAAGMTAFYRQFVQVRKLMPDLRSWPDQLPFSEGLRLVMGQHNRESWVESDGFYRLAPNDSPFTYWQAGWCGGGMNSYPMLVSADPLDQERAQRTMAFIFDQMQVPSGFFITTAIPGRKMGDDFQHLDKINIVLLRKMTDLIYFLLKQFTWLNKQAVQRAWLEQYEPALRRSCQALVELWQREGQWGQYIDIFENRVLIGRTAGPASGLAALALASQYFGEPAFLETACQAAAAYYQDHTLKGLTNGGPGEIAQCPDSESAFALLEGYVVLAEVTGDCVWTARALDAARQCASWCVSYDFRFPDPAEFGRLDMRTTGSVFANVQNKHSAPAICTFSGDALFKLYRLSGDPFCLDLLRDIAHNVMQYMSRDDRPIYSWDETPERLSSGTMSERVNMSDWEGQDHVGGVFNSQCWCAVSAMLTAIEVPGVYCQPDTGLVWCADHVTARLAAAPDGGSVLVVANPTPYPARVRILVEDSSCCSQPLGVTAILDCPVLDIPAGSQAQWQIRQSV